MNVFLSEEDVFLVYSVIPYLSRAADPSSEADKLRQVIVAAIAEKVTAHV